MRRNKYHARKTEVDGITFDSKREAAKYCELKLLQKAGEISNLRLQVKYPIEVNGQKICTYIADFVYVENGETVVADSKGMRKGAAFAMFRLKAKLVKAIYGIDVRLV